MVNMSIAVSSLLLVNSGSGDGCAARREASGYEDAWPFASWNSVPHAVVIAELAFSHTCQAVSLGAGTYE
jgi:hypothetical protein